MANKDWIARSSVYVGCFGGSGYLTGTCRDVLLTVKLLLRGTSGGAHNRRHPGGQTALWGLSCLLEQHLGQPFRVEYAELVRLRVRNSHRGGVETRFGPGVRWGCAQARQRPTAGPHRCGPRAFRHPQARLEPVEESSLVGMSLEGRRPEQLDQVMGNGRQ